MFGNFGLDEEGRLIRVEAGSQIDGGQFPRPLVQQFRVLGNRDSMLIDDTIVTFVAVLDFRKVAQCA